MRTLNIKCTLVALASATTLMGFVAAPAFSEPGLPTAEPVLWSSSQKSATWAEELLGQVVTYQTLSEKGARRRHRCPQRRRHLGLLLPCHTGRVPCTRSPCPGERRRRSEAVGRNDARHGRAGFDGVLNERRTSNRESDRRAEGTAVGGSFGSAALERGKEDSDVL